MGRVRDRRTWNVMKRDRQRQRQRDRERDREKELKTYSEKLRNRNL